MRKFSGAILALTCVFGFAIAQAQDASDTPELGTLQQSGYIMGPGSPQYSVDDTWKAPAAIMQEVKIFDKLVRRIQDTVCSNNQKKSVLVIGEPSQAYRYLWARVANATLSQGCANMWHVEINVNKIEAGNQYVGQVEQYWADNVLRPADKKRAVLYFPNLASLIGAGSHSNDQDGIEREYAQNIASGRLRSVAFMDKFEYNNYANSRHAYVVEAFADRVVLPPLETAEVDQLVTAYLKITYPHLTLGRKEADSLYRLSAYYNPNRGEPDRTLTNLDAMARTVAERSPDRSETRNVSFETTHPYKVNEKLEWDIPVVEGAKSVRIEFDSFMTEAGYDFAEVVDLDKNVTLDKFSGNLGKHARNYSATRLRLRFLSDGSGTQDGFKVSRIVYGTGAESYAFTLEDVRRAVMNTAQVPGWMITRDYTIIRNLEANLEKDVVGVGDGKADVARLAKIGYIAGHTEEKPVASILLAGPTGTGKSFIAKKVAEHLQLRLITLDMTAYKDPKDTITFTRTVARHLANNPFAVFMFEEIDKASLEVLDQLYFMTDEGLFYDEFQRPLFARGAFIIMTTNAGSDVILQNPDAPDLKAKVMQALQQSFRPSFLNRFGAISVFRPFNDAEFRRLAGIMSDKKAEKLKEIYGWELSWDEGTMNYLATQGRSRIFGARPMERLIENVYGIGIAEFNLQKRPIEYGEHIKITKAEGPNDFFVTVGQEKPLPFAVDPDMNEGDKAIRLRKMMNMDFWRVLRKNRMYTDK